MSRARDFWSDRRAGVAAETEQAAVADEQLTEPHTDPEHRTDAEILTELELPEPESLEQGDDFTVFMAKTVPEHIRRRALRALWRTNPILANVDQLVDYGEDFTDKANVIANLQTTYQVGKGMLAHVQEMARQAEESMRADSEAPDEAAVQDDVAEDATAEDAPDTVTEPSVVADTSEDLLLAEDEAKIIAPARRMTFRFEEAS